MTSERRGGGLTTPLELSLQDLIYAGLDALREVQPDIDLVAYLHDGGSTGPQLFLGAPTLGSMTPNDAFDLFTALRDALEQPAHESNGALGVMCTLGAFEAVCITTTGRASRGLHAVGRKGAPVSGDEAERITRLARSLGTLHNRLEEATAEVRAVSH